MCRIPIVGALTLASFALACGDDGSGATPDTTGVGEATGSIPDPLTSDGADETGSTGSPSTDVGMLASCPEDDLAVIPFSGPAFDPSTGELLEPLPLPHVVATTVGWHDSVDPDDLDDVLNEQTGLVIMDVFQRDGLLGASFATSDACGSARTVTLWRDEEALMEFVIGDAHITAIQTALVETRGWETTHWTEQEDDAPPSWDRVRQQLDDVRPD